MRNQLLSVFLYLVFYANNLADAQSSAYETPESVNLYSGANVNRNPYGNRVVHPFHRIARPVPKPTYVRPLDLPAAQIETTPAPTYVLRNTSTKKPATEYVTAAPNVVSIPARPTFRPRLHITSYPEQTEQQEPIKELEGNENYPAYSYGRPLLASRPIPRPLSVGTVTSPTPTVWTDKPIDIAENPESRSNVINIVPRPTIAPRPSISSIDTSSSAAEIQTPVELLSIETPDYQLIRRPALPLRPEQILEPNLQEVTPTLDIIYANSEPTPTEAINTATVPSFQSVSGYSYGRSPLQSRPIIRPIQVAKIPEQTYSYPNIRVEPNNESDSTMNVPIRPTFRPRPYISDQTTETPQLKDTISNNTYKETDPLVTEAKVPETTTQLVIEEPITESIRESELDTISESAGSNINSRYPRPYMPAARPVPKPIPVFTTTAPEPAPLLGSNSESAGSNFNSRYHRPYMPARPIPRPNPIFTTSAASELAHPLDTNSKAAGSNMNARYPRPYMPARPVPRPIPVFPTTATLEPAPLIDTNSKSAGSNMNSRYPRPYRPARPVLTPIPVFTTTTVPEPAPLLDINSEAAGSNMNSRYPRPYMPARPVPKPNSVVTTTTAPEPAPLLDINSESVGLNVNNRYPRPNMPARPVPRPIPEFTTIAEPTPLPTTHDTVAAYTNPEYVITTERTTTYPSIITIPPTLPSTIRPPIWTTSTKIPPPNLWKTTPSPKYVTAPPPLLRPQIPYNPYNMTKNTDLENVEPKIGSTGIIGIPYDYDSDYDCRQANGFYAFENECDTYLECKHNIAMKYECPDGLYFNPDALWPEFPCAYPSQVRCEGKSIKQTSSADGECPRKNGFFALLYEDDCGRYIICQDGLATIMHCPAGLVFNPEQSSCDWPENVPQCKPNAFKGFTCPYADEGAPLDMIYKFRYGNSCKEYIACQRGHPRLLSCDPGLAFEEESQTCIDHDYVRDCGFKA